MLTGNIRIRIDDDRCLHCSVHEQPSWFARVILRRQERDYPVWRIREPGNRYTWVDRESRPVSRRVADAIERAVMLRSVGQQMQNRLRVVRGGRK